MNSHANACKPRILPNQSDPRLHTGQRRFISPFSRPVGVQKLEHSVRQRAGELIDEVIGRGHGECLRELAQRFLYSAAETGQPAGSKAFGCTQPATQLPSCG